jgi:signal transduction histidine kinase
LADLSLAVFLFGIGIAWPGGLGPSRVDMPLAVLLVAGQSLPLAMRRSAPRTVFVVVGAASVSYGLSGFVGSPTDIGELVALYTVATTCRLVDSIAAGAAAIGGLSAVAINSPHWQGPAETLAVTLVFVLVLAVGRHQRLRVARLTEASHYAEELERRQGERMALAAAEERLHLAEELHDAVGHGLAIVLLQASVARRELNAHPDRARAAVGVIEERARAAMEEMQVLLNVVHDGETASRSPAPRIDDLDDLVHPVRAAGIEVTLQREGSQRALPEVIEVSAYRIVQEALTNVVRHSGATRAHVCLHCRDDVLDIEVSDNGRGTSDPTTSGGGRGLVGMSVRATRLGGLFDVDAEQRQGFTVRAQLPIPDRAVPLERVTEPR